MKRNIKIGSRDSKLAIAQTKIIIDHIQRIFPEITCTLVTMKTTGDMILDRSLDQIGGKGLFVKELDRALSEGVIDLSVHSLKDMPMEQDELLPIMALSRREDPRDVLILSSSKSPSAIEKIGSSSLRRKLQLKKLYPNSSCESVRGNIITRLRKLDAGEFDALVLAAAGLHRVGLQQRICKYFSPTELLPAAGQGILAVQGRRGENYSFLESIHNQASHYAAQAERTFVRTLNGGCSSPVAAYAQIAGTQIKLTGLYPLEENREYFISSLIGNVEQSSKLGEQLAEQMRREAKYR